MIQANDLKGSTPSNVTREPMFIRWWLLFVHKKVASIPNIQSILNHAFFSYIYTRICRLRNIGPPSRIHNTRLEKRFGKWRKVTPKSSVPEKAWWSLEWCCAPNRFAQANVLRQFFLMRSCIFKSSSWCFYTSLSVFKSDLSKQTSTLYTENEWPNSRIHSSYRRGRSGWK